MDGSSRQVLINTSIEWPNGITLDVANRFVLFHFPGCMGRFFSWQYDGNLSPLAMASFCNEFAVSSVLGHWGNNRK